VRRRALLAGSAAGLTSLAGCAGVFSDTDRSGSTVNPQLQGEPTTGRPAAVAWRANTADPQVVYPAGDAVVVTENNQRRFRALSTDNGATLWTATFEEPRRAFPGDVIVVLPTFGDDTVVGLDDTTGEQLWEVDAPGGVSTVTSEFVVVGATNDTDRTAVYDRRDGSRLWQTPLGKSPRGQVVRETSSLVITEIEDFRTTPRLSRGLPFYASTEAGGMYSPLTFSVPRFKRTSTGAPPSPAFCRRRRYCKPMFFAAL